AEPAANAIKVIEKIKSERDDQTSSRSRYVRAVNIARAPCHPLSSPWHPHGIPMASSPMAPG
ncbi:MAG: hypothetical protein ACREF0_09955, partial [Acetobacteraceae bacterium]